MDEKKRSLVPTGRFVSAWFDSNQRIAELRKATPEEQAKFDYEDAQAKAAYEASVLEGGEIDG